MSRMILDFPKAGPSLFSNRSIKGNLYAAPPPNLHLPRPLSPTDIKSCSNAQLKMEISIESPHVPNEPTASLPSETSLSYAMRALLDNIKLVMCSRPVVTPRVLKNLTRAPDLLTLSILLPYCGYSFTDGPWKHALIAFGVDPRQHPGYRIYQTYEFPYNYNPILPMASVIPLLTGEISLHRVVHTNHGNNSHIFDGNLLFTDDNVWQYCDISDDQLHRIWSTTTIRPDFCPRNGFFYNGTNAKLWEIMTDKIMFIRDGEELEADDYECLLSIPDDYRADSHGKDRRRYGLGPGQNYTRKQAFMRSLILKKAQAL